MTSHDQPVGNHGRHGRLEELAETAALGPRQGTKARSGRSLYPIGACEGRVWVWVGAAFPSPKWLHYLECGWEDGE